MPASLDHLVFGTLSLDEGARWLEERIGVPMSPGGEHTAMGTHNRLLRLGPRSYLELIAINPAAKPPGRPRWFGLDALSTRTWRTPRLLTWVAAVNGLPGAASFASFEPGRLHSMSRNVFHWCITIRDDGSMSEGGVLPALIEWQEGVHPAHSLPEPGVSLRSLELRVSEPEHIEYALKSIGFDVRGSPIHVVADENGPKLRACIGTPLGPVWFDSSGSID
jgi:hypothetical protein